MAAQSFTLTESSSVSAAHKVVVTNPKLKVHGLPGKAKVDVWVSFDGSDPTSADKAFTVENDSVGVLKLKPGNCIVFAGHQIPSGITVTVEIENS